MATAADFRTVALTAEQHAWAVAVGEGRHAADEHVRDATQYVDTSKWRYNRQAGSTVPCIAELAVAVYLDQHWAGAVWQGADIKIMEPRHPDIGRDIEARHLTAPNAGLVVRPKDVKAGRRIVALYANDPDPKQEDGDDVGKISTYTQFKSWTIVGIIDPQTAWANGKDAGNYRRVHQSHLDPIDTALRPAGTSTPPPLTNAEAERIAATLDNWEHRAITRLVHAAKANGDTRPVRDIGIEVARDYLWSREHNRFALPSPEFITAATRLGPVTGYAPAA